MDVTFQISGPGGDMLMSNPSTMEKAHERILMYQQHLKNEEDGDSFENGSQDSYNEKILTSKRSVVDIKSEVLLGSSVMCFETLEIIDLIEIPDDDQEDWLVPTNDKGTCSISELEEDKSYLDTGLLDIQFKLLNSVKGLVFESHWKRWNRKLEETKSKYPGLANILVSGEFRQSREISLKAVEIASPMNETVIIKGSELESIKSPDLLSSVYSTPGGTKDKLQWRGVTEMSPNTPLNYIRTPLTGSTTISKNKKGPMFSSPSMKIRNLFLEDELDDSPVIPIPHENYYGTPNHPGEFDSRTFTRSAVKNRAKIPVRDQNEDINERQSNVNTGNTTIIMKTAKFSYSANKNVNMNETFVHDDSDESTESPTKLLQNVSDHSQANQTHNLSYVVGNGGGDSNRFTLSHNRSFTVERVEASDNMNNFTLPNVPDLNCTFNFCPEDTNNPLKEDSRNNDSVHESLDNLHTRAKEQEEVLKMSSPSRTLKRRETHVIGLSSNDGNITLPRPPPRTSSTDTYCVGQSNPESPGSSGLSSPLESQSYDDLLSDSFRRSMPNLALSKKVSPSVGLSAPPLNSLQQKNYHTSDSKLSNNQKGFGMTLTKPKGILTYNHHPTISDHSSKEIKFGQQSRIGCDSGKTSTASSSGSLNGGGDAQQKPFGLRGVRGSLQAPRFTSIPLSRGVPPRTLGYSSGIPFSVQQQTQQLPSQLPSFRMNSRIPAPGASRLRPPSRSSIPGGKLPTNSSKPSDWRDGCY